MITLYIDNNENKIEAVLDDEKFFAVDFEPRSNLYDEWNAMGRRLAGAMAALRRGPYEEVFPSYFILAQDEAQIRVDFNMTPKWQARLREGYESALPVITE